MATFVHVADARHRAAIRKVGLSLPKARYRFFESEGRKWGIFALPVVEDFSLSHQWVRELARRGWKSAVGVYFRVPDGEPVWAGVYNEAKATVSASEAAAALRDRRYRGYEVIIPRAIKPREIHAIRNLPLVGWRYFPEAKGRPPACLCRFCLRGDIKSRRLRDRLDPDGNYA